MRDGNKGRILKKFGSSTALIIMMASFLLSPSILTQAEAINASPISTSGPLKLSVSDESNLDIESGSYTNKSKLKVSWTAVSGSVSYNLYSYSDIKAPSVRLLTTQTSSDVKPVNYVTTFTEVDLPRDGTYYYTVKAMAGSGTELASSETLALTRDTVMPKLSVINPKFNQEIIGNSLIVNGTVSDTNLDYYYFILRNATGDVLLTSTRIKEAVSNGVIANLDINTFLSGSYDIAFVAQDKAGNKTALTNSDETASFIVLRKGDGNNFSNPPRPQEPTATEIVPVQAPTTPSPKIVTPEFKLVSAPEVLGAISKTGDNFTEIARSKPSRRDATIIAVAKSPAKKSDDRIYLALIPMILAVILFSFRSRQTVTNNFTND